MTKQLSDADKALLLGTEPAKTEQPQAAAPATGAQAIALGQQAKAVLENPAFQRACAMIEEKYFEAFKRSDPNDSAGRERLYIGLAVMSTLIANLNELLGNGLKWSQQATQRARGRG